MSRVYNFSAGPAVLPETVLKEIADEMLDYQGSGMSVMEMSHRSPEFQKIIDDAEQDLRDLMNIPDNYKVLFLQGGASQQFAMIPMNLMKNKVADYIKSTNNHVLYRVTPVYKGDNLLATGVIMEAKSVEDNGEGILFNVFVYNIQNGIEIDYKTGESSLK